MKILIADDEPVSRLALQRAAEHLGHTCTLAGYGDEAGSHLERARFDVIVSAWKMPDLDGLEPYRKVGQVSAGNGPAVDPYCVIVIGIEDRQRAIAALEQGADNYLVTPLDAVAVHACFLTAARVIALRRHIGEQHEELERLRKQQRYATDVAPERLAERDHMLALAREQQARTEAESALTTRDDFLSLAAHELKTPLSSLHLQIQTLRRFISQNAVAVPVQRLETALQASERQVRRLTKLSNDLLDVSQSPHGSVSIAPQPVDLGALVKEVVDHFHYEVADAGCLVTMRLSCVVGSWGAAQIEQLVTNLLSNAIRFGRGKPLEISVDTVNDRARLSISDAGPGVSPADVSTVFERFGRIQSRENIGGLGLGLFLARTIAEAHGGHIRLHSEPGAGSTFVVELPLER